MKSFTIKTIFALLALAALASCKKEMSAVEPGASSIQSTAASKGGPNTLLTRIKTRTYGNVVDNYNYDASGNISVDKYGNDSTVFSYSNNSHISEFSTSTADYDYSLNAKGLAISNLSDYGAKTTFFYNQKKQLIETLIEDQSGSVNDVKNTYVNGNLDYAEAAYNGVVYATYQYTYYTDKSNVLDNDVFGKSFLGVGSKNLLKEMKITSDGVTNTFSYTYQFDGFGRVTVKKESLNGNVRPDYIFTYY